MLFQVSRALHVFQVNFVLTVEFKILNWYFLLAPHWSKQTNSKEAGKINSQIHVAFLRKTAITSSVSLCERMEREKSRERLSGTFEAKLCKSAHREIFVYRRWNCTDAACFQVFCCSTEIIKRRVDWHHKVTQSMNIQKRSWIAWALIKI